MQFASTFLSHASVDKPLVEAVAQRLGRRRVSAWLDKTELTLGSKRRPQAGRPAAGHHHPVSLRSRDRLRLVPG